VNTTLKIALALSLSLASIAGCATTKTPTELLTARVSYDQARSGAAASHDPADLHTAKKALDAAEHSFEEDGDTQDTRDLAYTADRRARIAEARGNASKSTEAQKKTIDDMHNEQATQLGQANKKLAAQGEAIEDQAATIASEKAAREAAEKRAAQAAADLAKFASVKEESRGMVITLSGGVLFASAKAELLPAAQLKLNSVADALMQQDPDSKMVVEGHTDSQGGDSYNQDLSQRRAQAVRDYLVTRGVASDRVTSQGFGSSRSVADNKSAEGRANNRRVEIVVEPKTAPRTP
jgi:outer membrane protein OmpA-like peptidoglycan-associated protein